MLFIKYHLWSCISIYYTKCMFFVSFPASLSHACIFNVWDFAFLLFIYYKPCFSTLYMYYQYM